MAKNDHDDEYETDDRSWLERNRWAGILILVVALLAIYQGPKLLNGGSDDEDPDKVAIKAAYTMVVDESRSVKVEIDGWVRPATSTEEADPGKVDVGLQSDGEVRFTNLDEERKVRSRDGVLEHDLVLKVPRDLCLLDDRRRETLEEDAFKASNCQATIVHIEPRLLVLDGGESKSQDFTEFLDLSDMGEGGVGVRFASFPEEDRNEWSKFVTTGNPAIVAGVDTRSDLVNGLNPECEVPLDDGGTATNATFWSSVEGVDFCW